MKRPAGKMTKCVCGKPVMVLRPTTNMVVNTCQGCNPR